jgi:hypothetical protein
MLVKLLKHLSSIITTYKITYMIRNNNIKERVGVAPMGEKMVETRLRWFGHILQRGDL